MIQRLAYYLIKGALLLIQALPLKLVAYLGRAGGALAWILDARHRNMSLANLTLCFGSEKTPAELRRIARETMRRLGENFACAVKTARMSVAEARKVCEVTGIEYFPNFTLPDAPRNCIVAIGHFGNFELNATLAKSIAGLRPAATYRSLRQPALDRLVQDLRIWSGCQFFDRRSDANALKNALNEGGLLLGLLSDQHAGRSGIPLPFLGHRCSTSAAPALLAIRYHCPLLTAVCFRTAPGRWKVEVGQEIPVFINGQARPKEDIMLEVNQAFEKAVRRDPANWFWVHNRWKGREIK